MYLNKSPTPSGGYLGEQNVGQGYASPGLVAENPVQNVGPARDASGRPLSSQQGIIASDSDNLFYPVNSTLPSQPYPPPNAPIQQQNPTYIQPFSHIPTNRGHLSQPPPSFHLSLTSYPVSSYNNPNFIPPPLSSSHLETPVQHQYHHHQLPRLPNNFPHHNNDLSYSR